MGEARRTIGEEPPLPPGTAPFHTKGEAFLGHLAWVDASYPGGREAFLAALSPSMRAYFETRFEPSGWYDVFALAAAGQVCARALDMPFGAFVTMRAKHQARLDMSGTYRLLLKVASPRLVAERIPSAMSQYLDFGEAHVLRDTGEGLSAEFVGAPAILAEWLAAVYEGYFDVVVTAAGGTPEPLRVVIAAHPDTRGFPAVTLRVDGRFA